jgi:small GTP-binding protein
MLQKKICILGAFAVGKTSLVARYVHSMFSEKYLTTVGVKIDKKVVEVGEASLTMILWDLHGEDDFQSVRTSYLRGMSGYLLIVDGTRLATLDTARELHQRARDTVGDVPLLCVVNKDDLQETWEVTAEDLSDLARDGWDVVQTSAKTGDRVEATFLNLAKQMLDA